MNGREIGEVIAQRKLIMTQTDGAQSDLLVLLGRPCKFEDSTDFYAPFQVRGIGSERVVCAGGVDSFQALQGAMKVIPSLLEGISQDYHVTISWEYDETGRLGFLS